MREERYRSKHARGEIRDVDLMCLPTKKKKKSRYASVERTSTGRISTPGLGRSCRLLLRPALLLLGDCEEYEDVAAPPPLDCSAGPVASSRSPVLPGSFAIKSVYCVSDFVVLTKEHGREEQRIKIACSDVLFFWSRYRYTNK